MHIRNQKPTAMQNLMQTGMLQNALQAQSGMGQSGMGQSPGRNNGILQMLAKQQGQQQGNQGY
jgi:hypothetical protein